MFWNVLRMERSKLFHRKLFWIELALIVVLFLLIGIPLYAIHRSLPASILHLFDWPGGLVITLSFTSSFCTTLLIILAGMQTAQEYSWRTMQQWLGHGVSRSLLLVGKLFMLLVAALFITLASLLIGGGLSALFSVLVSGTLHVGQVNFVQLLLATVNVFYSLLPYIALTFMLAVVSRSTVIALAGSLLYTLLLEPTLVQLLLAFGNKYAYIAQYLPKGLVSSLLAQSSAISQMPIQVSSQSSLSVNPTVAAVGIALYTLVFATIALWAFSRQDLSN